MATTGKLDTPALPNNVRVSPCQFPCKGGDIVCPLGIGTIWCGRKWPPQNEAYVDPDFTEVHDFLSKAFARLSTGGERVIIDTAAGYGYTEERLGQFFGTPIGASLLPHALIHTKFGHSGHGDPLTEKLTLDMLRKCWDSSCSTLPRIDGLYYHLTSSMPEEQCLETLRDAALTDELVRLRGQKVAGLTVLGAAIPNAKVLVRAWKEGLLAHLDMVQLPQRLAREEPELLSDIRASGKAVILNSPVRSFSNGGTPTSDCKNCYTDLWSMPFVSVVLTGTRNHLDETLGYCGR